MGTPEPARLVLEKILESGSHELAGVVSQPDRPAGRGRKNTPPPVKAYAEEQGIPVFQPEKIKGNEEFRQRLGSLKPDILVVVAYGKILPPEILQIPRLGGVNVHYSLLPRYRGAAPVQWAIMNGDMETGVTIMKLSEGLDEGDILDSESVEILDDDDTVSITNYLTCVGADLLLRVLAKAEKTGELKGTPQEEAHAGYAPRITRENAIVDWSLPSRLIVRRVHGLRPWPCAISYAREREIKILEAVLPHVSDRDRLPETAKDKIKPGTVVDYARGKGFYVRTGDGFLLVTCVKPENKSEMSGDDCVNGGYVKIGTRFTFSPQET